MGLFRVLSGAGRWASDLGPENRHNFRLTTHTPELRKFSAVADGTVPRMPTDVEAHITGTVWKIEVSAGQSVAPEDTLVIIESMKMEMPVEAPRAGVVGEIRAKEGQAVAEGDVLLVLE